MNPNILQILEKAATCDTNMEREGIWIMKKMSTWAIIMN